MSKLVDDIPPSTSFRSFWKLWTLTNEGPKTTSKDVWEFLKAKVRDDYEYMSGILGTDTELFQEGDEDKDNVEDEDEASEEDSDDNDDIGSCEADSVLCLLLEDWEKQVSWNPSVNLEGILFCYASFNLGSATHKEDREQHPDEKGRLLPNFELFTGLPETVDPLSTSTIQCTIWYMLGFEYMQTCHRHEFLHPLCRNGFTSKSLTPKEFAAGTPYEQVNNKDDDDKVRVECCIFVSHRWAKPDHPDRSGYQAQIILELLSEVQAWIDAFWSPPRTHAAMQRSWKNLTDARDESSATTVTPSVRSQKLWSSDAFLWAIRFVAHGHTQVRVWYDYYSIPQGKDATSKSIRQTCLQEIGPLCQSMMFLGLIADDYFQRGWCAFEMIQHQKGVPLGSRLWTSPLTHQEWEASKHATNQRAWDHLQKQLDALVYQDHFGFLARKVYGQFCGLLENQADTEALCLLENLGIKCTNGADMTYVSKYLQEEIMAHPKEPLMTYVHPMVSAIGRFLEQHVFLGSSVDNQRDKSTNTLPTDVLWLCQSWRNHLRMAAAGPEEVATTVNFRWRYPDDCLEYLLELKQDIGGLPAGYEQNVQRALNDVLSPLREVVRQTQLDATAPDFVENLPATPWKEQLQQVLGLRGYFVLVKF